MRVLLTNHRLCDQTGSELWVRDVALALLARGHQPILYSRHLGDLALRLRRATITVLNDLENLDHPPDLIHGHHHLETMTALTRFPGVPAVFFCHGWLPDEEAPPLHPRILRYVAVDELVRQRLRDECGIEKGRVETHLNFVDLERFSPRQKPLPVTARRALVFSNYATEWNYLPTIREACQTTGLALDVLGKESGQETQHPEDHLGDYDIVFAKGRAALEAAAVGSAVILCDRSGLGPMVSLSELPHLRSFNFGARLLGQRITPVNVAKEIASYDPLDATETAKALRREVCLDSYLDRLLDLYARSLADFENLRLDPRDEALANHRYFRSGPLGAGDPFSTERRQLQEALARERIRNEDLTGQLAQSFRNREEMEARFADLAAKENDCRKELEDAGHTVRELLRSLQEGRSKQA